MTTKIDAKLKLEKILKFALKESEGIINPKQLKEKNLIKDYQEWAGILKQLKEYSGYEFRELDEEELKVYNINSSDSREKYYIIIDKDKKNQVEAYINLLKKEKNQDKKLELVKNIISPSKGFVKYLRSIGNSDIEFLLGKVISVLKEEKEFWNKIFESDLLSFLIGCLKDFELSNNIKKKIAEFAYAQFIREKDEYLTGQNSSINLNRIVEWYRVYLISYLNIFTDLPSPELNTILKWGEKDMSKIDPKDTTTTNKFINLYEKLLITHIKNTEKTTLNKQKLNLPYEYIIEKETEEKDYKKHFYYLFENLNKWKDWELLLG
jgi:hypothetical protein